MSSGNANVVETQDDSQFITNLVDSESLPSSSDEDPWEEDCRDEISSESPGSSHHHRGKSLVLNYVAGYCVRKSRSARHMITREIETNGPNSWIHVMSRNQSLTVPSKEAAFQCIKSEKCFERFHGVGLKVKDPFNRLSSLI